MLDLRTKVIVSDQNVKYKQWLKLKQKKQRQKQGQFLVEGIKLSGEAIVSGLKVSAFLIDGSKDVNIILSQLKEVSERALTEASWDSLVNECDIFVLDERLFLTLAETEQPQGLISVISFRQEFDGEEITKDDMERMENQNVLVLDRLQDPGNLGTILRTAEAADFCEIWVLKGTGDLYNPKVVRASAGAIFRMKLRFMSGPHKVLEWLEETGKNLMVTSLETDQTYYDADLRNCAIVIGNEGGGVCSQLLNAEVAEKIKIPMSNNVESLNAAVAAALLMYEAKRQATGL